jgi:imidazole glycerol phosphate synthase glutamine amidotransferase subunit
MIGVIDYGAGNLGSVMNALGRLSVPARFVSAPEELLPASSPFEKIIFPGDGHFAAAMASITNSGYAQAIKEWIKADKPFLGICIGLQLLFDTSEEAPGARGLSVISGTVRRFPGRKVPQIGWNQTYAKSNSLMFSNISDNSFFYYIHSFYADPADNSVCAAETEYYLRYCCAVERGALCAVQFHPEKSGAAGIALLKNWTES